MIFLSVRLSAAFLGLIAVAAAAPPLLRRAGIGQPSQDEFRDEILARIAAGGRPSEVIAGYGSGGIRFLPFDDDALLLIGLACAASAVAVLALGRLLLRGRGEDRPMRWRMSLALWGIAFALVSIRYGIFLLSSATATPEYGMAVVAGFCPGFTAYSVLGILTSPVLLLPDSAVVAVGFVAWALLVRKGHRRWGRAAGWLAVIPLAWFGAMAFVMAGVDAVVGDGCARGWSELVDPSTLTWHLYGLVAAVLIILAVRVRRLAR